VRWTPVLAFWERKLFSSTVKLLGIPGTGLSLPASKWFPTAVTTYLETARPHILIDKDFCFPSILLPLLYHNTHEIKRLRPYIKNLKKKNIEPIHSNPTSNLRTKRTQSSSSPCLRPLPMQTWLSMSQLPFGLGSMPYQKFRFALHSILMPMTALDWLITIEEMPRLHQ